MESEGQHRASEGWADSSQCVPQLNDRSERTRARLSIFSVWEQNHQLRITCEMGLETLVC